MSKEGPPFIYLLGIDYRFNEYFSYGYIRSMIEMKTEFKREGGAKFETRCRNDRGNWSYLRCQAIRMAEGSGSGNPSRCVSLG
ncbi:hypothetical protein BSF_03650 [Bacillus subtilis]|nr:hypothetical protein BSF_03650 [Bacillus subtilis]